ncbi:MAG TPA: hypothetical protein VK789_27970 [Bryobacteraceae bacterium]|nr:hypothetical protein [Bryobacteraceae bacterium]
MKIEPRFLFLAALPVSVWHGYGHDEQHTALSQIAAQALTRIHWSAPVDLNPQLDAYTGELYVHYGSPVVTAANTILMPVKTVSTDGFEVQARNGATGALLYTLSTDYTLPSHNWVPPYGIVLSAPGDSFGDRAVLPGEDSVRRERPVPEPLERLYYPGAGGTVYYRDRVDSSAGPVGQIAFYGNTLYSTDQAAFNSAVKISTPLTADSRGNIYFGFVIQGANPAGLTSGIARIAGDGSGSWMSAPAFAGGDSSITQVALNCAPALSPDQRTIYFAVSDGSGFGSGYLVSADSTTLAPIAHTRLQDPRGGLAVVTSDSSASPTIGPDGDVFFGVLENNLPSHNQRGWMLHFDASLANVKVPGSFGWDDTPSIVPANLVPSYSGSSAYLILVKYNNYAGSGTGDGVNKLAILDPNASQQDEYSATPVEVMHEVLTVTGVTPEPQTGFPNAVREWCINSAAIDPSAKSALVNSEDGVLYRWDFTTNTLIQSLRLTPGLGEAYTPTIIGADGTVYAINDSGLFAVGN